MFFYFWEIQISSKKFFYHWLATRMVNQNQTDAYSWLLDIQQIDGQTDQQIKRQSKRLSDEEGLTRRTTTALVIILGPLSSWPQKKYCQLQVPGVSTIVTLLKRIFPKKFPVSTQALFVCGPCRSILWGQAEKMKDS